MSYAIVKQDIYSAPIDGLFILKLYVESNDKDYLDLIGNEFVSDFQTYKIITIMQDIPTGEYFALCKLLMTPEDDNIALVGSGL